MPAQNQRWGGSLKAACIWTYLLMLYTQRIGYSALDCSFWSAEQPLPEPQQAGQEQRLFFTRQDTAPTAGRFERNSASLVTGFNAVTGDRKRQGCHKANQPAPKHLSHPAGVAARAQKRWEKCFANSKQNLRWFVPGTLRCSITSAIFPTLSTCERLNLIHCFCSHNLHLDLAALLEWTPFFFFLLSSFPVFVSECKAQQVLCFNIILK